MGRRKRNYFDDSVINLKEIYQHYLDRLIELSCSMFEWSGLPDTVDERYLELTLFNNGQAVFFKDDVMGYLALADTAESGLDVYNTPIRRRAIANNGYQMQLDEQDSVIIWNNYLRTNSAAACRIYAKRLANLDVSIDVNSAAQRTPILLLCDESERLTLENVFKDYIGGVPVIKGYKGLDTSGFTVLKTDAPYVADKLYDLKSNIWNEALTYLGISNVNITKKERMITDEVQRNLGGTMASRYSRLESRRNAAEKINKMFGLNIECNYRDDFSGIDTIDSDYQEGEGKNE